MRTARIKEVNKKTVEEGKKGKGNKETNTAGMKEIPKVELI